MVAIVLVLGAGYFFIAGSGKSTTKPTPTNGSYVALGDSVAAGVGLPTPSDASACERSNESYPQQFATQNNYTLRNLACSGATIANGIEGSQTVNMSALKPQLTALFALPRPSIISIQIGANDVGLLTTLAGCYTGNCATEATSVVLGGRLLKLETNLAKSLDELSQHYGNKSPHVVVMGYYQVFSAKPLTCPDTSGVDELEQNFARSSIDHLNSTLEAVARKYDFATYAQPDFAAHELCTSQSYIQGLNTKYPYHPTTGGQKAIAEQLADALKKKVIYDIH